MQCFTSPSLFPRTSLSCDYRAPEPHHYHRRPHYVPEPDKNGRMWNPDAFKPPPPFKQACLVYEPVNPRHREGKIEMMLEHINKVNWITSQSSRIHAARDKVVVRSSVNFRHSDKMPTVTNTTYVDHGPQPVDRKYMSNIPAIGIRPCTYPLPYHKDRCVRSDRPIGCLPRLTPLYY